MKQPCGWFPWQILAGYLQERNPKSELTEMCFLGGCSNHWEYLLRGPSIRVVSYNQDYSILGSILSRPSYFGKLPLLSGC